ncbi:MAG: hypothetical protein ACE5KE_09405 [Methanosarcinales archaeon]
MQLKSEAFKLLKKTENGREIIESVRNLPIIYADLVINDDVSGISNGKIIINPEISSPAFLAIVMAFESVEVEYPPSLDTLYLAYKRASSIWKELQKNGLVVLSKLTAFEIKKITELIKFSETNKNDLRNKLAKRYGYTEVV